MGLVLGAEELVDALLPLNGVALSSSAILARRKVSNPGRGDDEEEGVEVRGRVIHSRYRGPISSSDAPLRAEGNRPLLPGVVVGLGKEEVKFS